MRKYILLFGAAVMLLLLATCPIEAGINPRSVLAIWETLTRKAEISNTGPVNIENKKEPNAWVSFSLDKYSVHATSGLLNTLRDEDEL